LPALSCLKIAGPLPESFIAMNITTKTGDKTTTAGKATIISKIRLRSFPIAFFTLF
jgi:hypothetical protein